MWLLLLSRFSRVRPCAIHRRQPTRFPRPWDSPGKNTGVGCHFLLQCIKVKSQSEVTQSSLTLSDPTPWTAAYQAPPSLGFSREEYWSGVPWPSPLEWLVNVFSLDGMVLRMLLLVVGFCLHWVFQLVLAFFSLQW